MQTVTTNGLSGAVGLRELRANLSAYVDEVKAGQAYTLTEHGKPVARLMPLEGQSAYEHLVAKGAVQPAPRRAIALDPPVDAGCAVNDLVGEQRR